MVQPIGVDIVLCCVRLKFEKSSPVWRIVGEKINLIDRELCWSSAKVDAINGVKYESILVVSMVDYTGGTQPGRLGIWPS